MNLARSQRVAVDRVCCYTGEAAELRNDHSILKTAWHGHLPSSAKYGVPPLAGMHPNGTTSPSKIKPASLFPQPATLDRTTVCRVAGQPHAPAPFKRLTGLLESDASGMPSSARSPGRAVEQTQFHVPCGCRGTPPWCRKFALIPWSHGRRDARAVGNHILLITPTAAAY